MNLLGNRVEGFRVDLLDLADNVVGVLPAVEEGGRLDFSVYATIRGSGNLTVQTDQAIDWLAYRVRVYYLAGEAPDVLEVPLITAIPRAPVERHTATATTIDVELYDKTVILNEDSFGASYATPAGTNIIAAVRDVITSTGEPASAQLLTESPATLAAGLVWDAGATKLKIVNDLLDAAGYFALYCDGLGRFRADPYTTPSARPVEWQFAGPTALYLPAYTRDRDVFAVPNRYVCIGRSDGAAAALRATATDIDPASPYSYPSRGRWITRTDKDVEAATQAVLEMLAARRLYEAQQVTETLEFTHPWLGFALNSVIQFGTSRAVIWKSSLKLNAGGLITSTARRLV